MKNKLTFRRIISICLTCFLPIGIAKERVDLRVSKGGHGIPHRDIERRYVESLENLFKITPSF